MAQQGRVTRSQSREKSADPVDQLDVRRARQARDLSPLFEQQSSHDSDAEEDDNLDDREPAQGETAQGREDDADGSSPSYRSAERRLDNGGPSQESDSSGFSEHELKQLDAQVVLDYMPNLHQQALRIIETLLPRIDILDTDAEDQHYSDLKDNQSSLYKTWARHEALFVPIKQSFTTQHFIRADIVLRAILGDKFSYSNSFWSPGDILYHANLASLADQVVKLFSESSIASHNSGLYLQELYVSFPSRFIKTLVGTRDAAYVIGESRLLDEVHVVAVELRTQWALSQMLSVDGNRDRALAILARVFMGVDEDDGTPADLATFDDLSAFRLDDFEDPQSNFAKKALQRFKFLVRVLLEDDEKNVDAVIKELVTRDFPTSSFCEDIMKWVRLRHVELVTAIGRRRGVDIICAALQDKMARQAMLEKQPNTNAPPSAATLSSGVRPLAPPSSRLSAMQTLKRMSATSAAVNVNDVDQGTVFSEQMPFPIDDHDDAEISYQQSAEEAQQASQESARRQEPRSKNAAQKKSLIDRQENARRIAWNDGDAESQAEHMSKRAPPSSRLGKRRRESSDDESEQMDYEPTQDDGFQNDNRAHAVPTRRLAPAARAQETNAKRTTLAAQRQSVENSRQIVQRRSASDYEDDQQENDDDDDGDDDDHAPRMTNEDRAFYTQQTVRDREIRVRASGPKGQESRVAWSFEEDQALIEAVGRVGGQWAIIFNEDRRKTPPVFMMRKKNLALRDRAQQLKMNFLIARQELPEGFDDSCVKLNKMQVERITRLGGHTTYTPTIRNPPVQRIGRA